MNRQDICSLDMTASPGDHPWAETSSALPRSQHVFRLAHATVGGGFGALSREVPASPIRKGVAGMGNEQDIPPALSGETVPGQPTPDQPNPGQPVRYRTFISYSHADERVAIRLHRWLENYRLPNRVVGRSTARGKVPRRLSPIFRDRNELPASNSLHEEVSGALTQSACLIVLCSPAARASRWVDAEIALFRTLHPDRPVLAALIAGEPADAFPEALTAPDPNGMAREPIAADFRPHGDGRRLARLKIVAGITGVALDELVQRDAQRQLRQAVAVTGASVALVILLLALLVLAINARNDAERQRQQAEGLIEFMLTDLRTGLQGVGRLDILESVNERALDYYVEQGDLSRLPSESLERRARVLHAMGEDDHRRGNLGAAIAKFSEAHRVTAALLSAEPGDPARIYAHAQSEFWLGYADFLQQQHARAQPHFEEYLRLAQQLTRLEPGNSAYLRELGYAEGNLCSLHLARRSDIAVTLETCRVALETMQRVDAASPGDPQVRLDVANRHAWLADAFEAAGQTDQALDQRQQQAAIMDLLVTADPDNASYRQDWVLSRFSIAMILRNLGETEASLASARDASDAIHRLTTADPDNQDWQRWRVRINQAFPNASSNANKEE